MTSPLLPYDLKAFKKEMGNFVQWLTNHGSEIRVPSNPFEVLRFTTPDGVGVIYRDKSDHISAWENGSKKAWLAFKTGDNTWRLAVKRERRHGQAYGHQGATIIERDGPTCFYCGNAFHGNGELKRTIEHLVSVIHGGPDHLSNLVLAHQICNQAAGNLSVAEKIRLREKMRASL